MWELARAASKAEDLLPEERRLLQRLAWNRQAWRSGLIDWLRPPDAYPRCPSFGAARIVHAGAFSDAEGSRHQVFVCPREIGLMHVDYDLACVVTDRTYNLQLWRRLDEVMSHEFGGGYLFEKAAIRSKPSPVLEVSFTGWGTYRFRISPDSMDLIDIDLPDDLEALELHFGTNITPLLDAMKDLKGFRYLDLSGTDLCDAELAHIAPLVNLAFLDLTGTAITDAGLQHLKGLSSLKELDLGATRITDAGLEHLEGMTSLVYLDLTDTQVTPEGVKKLQEALPGCQIVY